MRRLSAVATATAALLILGIAPESPTPSLTFAAGRITQAIERELAADRAPGAAVAVVYRGDIVYARAFGVRRAGGNRVDLGTRFEIGSDTKQFTAAAILQLKEQGKLALDDRLAKYVSSFPHAKEITLRQLLAQTSGLPDYLMTNHFVHISQTSRGSFERIERMVAGSLHFSPGSHWEYSNTNYIALGRVVEVASGQSYDVYLREHLFAPAGMRQSTTIAQEASLPNVATGYWHGLRGNAAMTPAPPIGQSWTWSAGDIVSTVGDLVKWDGALQTGKIIAAKDFSLMTSPVRLTDGKFDDYGFGWWIDPVSGHTDVYHDGDTFGMSSSNNLFFDEHLAIVVLENVANDAAAKTAHKIFAAILERT